MANTKKITNSYEKTNEIKPLCLYVTIVNRGQANAIVSMFQRVGSSAQFINVGTGTASRNVLDILGIEDNEKEVVYCFIKEELVPEAKKELEAFFAINKKNKGIGFSIKLTSIIGVKLYRFLTNSF